MNDLNTFLSDAFQYRLKEKASDQSSNRFENTLENYYQLFFESFDNLVSAHKVKYFDHLPYHSKDTLYDWIDGAYKGLQTKKDEFQEFFSDLIKSYQLFIDGKHYKATIHIFDVLEKYDIADVISPGELGIFYKGRAKPEGNAKIGEDYFYHIPFDKRFLIGNQRFSFSGQPILYIGSSILDVLYELRHSVDNFNEIAIASFAYDQMIENTINKNTQLPFQKLKIYDVSNHIHNLINGVLNNLIRSGGGIPKFNDPLYSPNLKDIIRDFKKFILTQICTFKRTHGQTFIEEYIPAQILTEALRINGYHGVKFPSTQFDGKDIQTTSILYPSNIQANLALFTSYSCKENYDLDTMKYFFIKPLDFEISDKKSVDEYNTEYLELQNEIMKKGHPALQNLRWGFRQ
ncbi:hypothetical protein [Pedobacter roseus]|uniref:Uncharacterized protein n=1 Tax=Pedobacter roseus TaxID=336820 RepID=A0A7G9QKU7_9SPHI|nr:hypothetical protein [Pedobacter roseus]QNN43972.1 hypothetical protein H9L23_07795 [Pedobacter roseus]